MSLPIASLALKKRDNKAIDGVLMQRQETVISHFWRRIHSLLSRLFQTNRLLSRHPCVSAHIHDGSRGMELLLILLAIECVVRFRRDDELDLLLANGARFPSRVPLLQTVDVEEVLASDVVDILVWFKFAQADRTSETHLDFGVVHVFGLHDETPRIDHLKNAVLLLLLTAQSLFPLHVLLYSLLHDTNFTVLRNPLLDQDLRMRVEEIIDRVQLRENGGIDHVIAHLRYQ